MTIIFNDIPAFGDICKKCDGMKIVGVLNSVFGIFDVLTDRNNIYKVETVKDSFVGVSGAPDRVTLNIFLVRAKRIKFKSLWMNCCHYE